MKAAVLYQAKEPLQIEEIEVGAPRDGEVGIRVMAAGVCHSDHHFMNGDLPISLPCVLGHEGAGVVEAVGPGVTEVAPGDHVVMLFRAACGRCDYCARGRPALCTMAGRLRTSGRMLDGTSRFSKDGAEIHHFLAVSCFAERTVAPVQGVVKIPKSVPLEIAALMGCSVLTGVGAVLNTAGVSPGESVLVIGAGGVGLNCVMGARLAGAHPIIAADLSESKLKMALDLGATQVINAGSQDLVAAVRDLSGGEGVDHAFEAIGNAGAMRQAFEAVRRGGQAVAVGIAPVGTRLSIDAGELVYSEKTLRGSYYGTSRPHTDVPRLLNLYLEGRLPLDRLLSRRYRLEDVNEAFRALLAGEVARSVLIPGS